MTRLPATTMSTTEGMSKTTAERSSALLTCPFRQLHPHHLLPRSQTRKGNSIVCSIPSCDKIRNSRQQALGRPHRRQRPRHVDRRRRQFHSGPSRSCPPRRRRSHRHCGQAGGPTMCCWFYSVFAASLFGCSRVILAAGLLRVRAVLSTPTRFQVRWICSYRGCHLRQRSEARVLSLVCGHAV